MVFCDHNFDFFLTIPEENLVSFSERNSVPTSRRLCWSWKYLLIIKIKTYSKKSSLHSYPVAFCLKYLRLQSLAWTDKLCTWTRRGFHCARGGQASTCAPIPSSKWFFFFILNLIIQTSRMHLFIIILHHYSTQTSPSLVGLAKVGLPGWLHGFDPRQLQRTERVFLLPWQCRQRFEMKFIAM